MFVIAAIALIVTGAGAESDPVCQSVNCITITPSPRLDEFHNLPIVMAGETPTPTLTPTYVPTMQP